MLSYWTSKSDFTEHPDPDTGTVKITLLLSGTHKRHANSFFTNQATKENDHGRRHVAI